MRVPKLPPLRLAWNVMPLASEPRKATNLNCADPGTVVMVWLRYAETAPRTSFMERALSSVFATPHARPGPGAPGGMQVTVALGFENLIAVGFMYDMIVPKSPVTGLLHCGERVQLPAVNGLQVRP